LITGYDDEAFMSRVPARVHKNDRHLVAAALVMANGLDEEDDPARHYVLIVSDNTKHLAVADTRKLGIEVVKAGSFLDNMFEAEPQRSIQAISKSLSDLKKPPYSRQEMLAALRLHGARATAKGLAQSWAVEEKR
jgi:hypothetical protein